MVIVLPPAPRKENLGTILGRGLGQAARETTAQRMQKESAAAEEAQKMRLLEKEFSLKSGLESQKRGAELAQKFSMQQPGFEDIKRTFGDKFANLWKASEPGAQTKLVEMGLDAIMRGDDINELLSSAGAPPIPQEEYGKIPENIPQLEKGKIAKDFQWPDFNKRPQGYTPKSWADQKKVWRDENLPVFTENSKKLTNTEKDILSTKVLHKINKSKKLPEGLERLLVNPETGDFYGPAQVLGFKSPEAQQWSKVIAQFQNRAKDAFGSRVTNFDLQSYMQQFPGLLNTPEGRDRILRMMDINFELDALHEKAMDEIYKHYGLSGIPYEKADELARKMISQRMETLRNEYLDLDQQNEQESGQVEKLSGRMVDVYDQNGNVVGEVDESQVGSLPEGYRIK